MSISTISSPDMSSASSRKGIPRYNYNIDQEIKELEEEDSSDYSDEELS